MPFYTTDYEAGRIADYKEKYRVVLYRNESSLQPTGGGQLGRSIISYVKLYT